ncbi:helix-turn-helix domain-containing protein [Staphylococcus coagulans]|nr:helix-turn-helix domain-containing protein [Staphylococcus coagulans]UNB46767.1 helix-turn-helix domain-containing protein [Staphylococcus coagulans]
MNKKEVAEYIGVSFNTLKKFIKAGLKTVEIEGIEMIRKVDIDEFIEKRVK